MGKKKSPKPPEDLPPELREPPQERTPGATRGNITKCVYFPDASIPEELKELLRKYPRATFSSLMDQCCRQIILVLREKENTKERKIEVLLELWL